MEEIQEDLHVFDSILRTKSSYQGLNGYYYREDLDLFLNENNGKSISKTEFGILLSKIIGKIGDRHAYIKGYDLPESLYFPMSFAPYQEKVLVIERDNVTKKYNLWDTKFPYISKINHIPIDTILSQILPNEALAPKKSYLLRSVRDLRDIETAFRLMNMELPNPLSITLKNDQEIEKEVKVTLVERTKRAKIWDERYNKPNFFFDRDDKKINDPNVIKTFFRYENDYGYIQIPSMIDKQDSPVYFDLLNKFMTSVKNSQFLIIDVRDNGGGNREFINELAGYFIHKDSIHVVNVAQQRRILLQNDNFKERLNARYLYSNNQLNEQEQSAVAKFTSSFQPIYQMNDNKYSENHYFILNGKDLSKDKYHYNKPVYILANERTFSAASILVSVFKNLPNITIAGITTDGSSGNSERFKLPNSGLRVKISTMVSFQKDGNILDGMGTKPDIIIERNLDQIFFKEDHQLKKLIEIAKSN
ncbi:hypothetical protein GCM10009117_00760 [Gangjinia marincola]|uniref:Tail specific protease domain-containing protein n=2 Tax=Gangjinia marincola TaxID=578463 RepID=A0ABN1MCY6_9FLAO